MKLKIYYEDFRLFLYWFITIYIYYVYYVYYSNIIPTKKEIENFLWKSLLLYFIIINFNIDIFLINYLFSNYII